MEKWVVVEAKAHLGELGSTSGAKYTSRAIIENVFYEYMWRSQIITIKDFSVVQLLINNRRTTIFRQWI